MPKFSFKEIAPCLFAIFIDIMGYSFIVPMLVALFTVDHHDIFFLTTKSLRYFCLGVALSLYPLAMFFGTSFLGDISDRIGRKKTLIFSMCGMFLCSFFSFRGGILGIFLFPRDLFQSRKKTCEVLENFSGLCRGISS